MSGLCKLTKFLGADVMGSDISNNDETRALQDMGITVFHQHDEKNISSKIDMVVYSGAIKCTNPELMEASRRGIKIMERSKFLGVISRMYTNVIAVSGTHGKTTTTAQLGYIFAKAGLNPTIHLGGESINLNGNTIIGDNKYFICEACEYRESFKYLNPNTLLVTNVESDHLDYFKTDKRYKSAFRKIMRKSRCVIKDKSVCFKHKKSIIVGKNIKAENVRYNNHGYYFDVILNKQNTGNFRLNVIGMHNITNALFAIITAIKYNIPIHIIKEAVSEFKGVRRRYERIGNIREVPVIIDYAHHPTEIKNSISGIKAVYKNPLIIFQPHTYSRTLDLKNEFMEVLVDIADLILFKTYPAREEEIIGGRAWDLYQMLGNSTHKYFDDERKLYEYAVSVNKNYDCVLILGAGDLAVRFAKILDA